MILCCGEALIDMLPRKGPSGEEMFAPHAGGAVFNTAIALGRLGAPAGMLTGLSTDLFGQRLEKAMQASGVDASGAVRSERPTTLAFVTLTDGQARYAFYDENTAGRMIGPGDLPEPGPGVEAMFFGGISLAVEPCGGAYEALALAQSGRRALMLDPNVRPAFIADEAGYRARIGRLIDAADIVKLSDEDLVWLQGDGDPEDRARGLLARGPRLVCITEGARGAMGVWAGETVRVKAPKVEVADTVGAGDTFNAGVLAALHEVEALAPGLPALGPAAVEAALSLGVRSAAVTVSRPGADPPLRAEL
jgi:fructokinase